MPIQAKAEIVIKAGPEALKVLQGLKRETNEVAKAAQKAAKEEERAAKAAQKAQETAARATQKAQEAAARATQKAARETAKVQQKAAQDAAKAVEREQQKIERAALKEAERWQTLAQKSRDVRIRAQERATQAAQREAAKQIELAKKTAAAEAQARRDAVRKAGGLLMAGTAGALAGATVAAGTARGIAGIKDQRERITSANEFRERLVVATSDAKMNAQQRETVQGQVLAASTATGKDIGELMSVLETGQAQFNNLKFFADNLKEIAVIAKSANADTGDFAMALGSVQAAFGLTSEQAMEAGYLMKAAAASGSVELKDFARDFASAAGLFQSNTGQTGMEGVRQFLGASQATATGRFGSAESATRMTQAVSFLNRATVQKELKGKAGVDMKKILGPGGKMDVGKVLDALAGSKKFMSSAGLRQDIFSDAQAREGIMAMLTARQQVKEGRAGAIDFGTISKVNASEGREAVESTFATMQNEGFFKMQQLAAEAQADTVKNLEKYNADILLVAETSNRLEQAFGRLALWADAIAAVGVVGTLTNTLGKLAGGAAEGGALAKALPSVASAGGAVTGGATAALAAGSTAVGAASGAAIGGTVLAGGAIGYGIGTGINALSAMGRQDEKTWSDRIGDYLFESLNKNDARFQKGTTIDNAIGDSGKRLVTVMEANNRALERVEQGIRAVTMKPEPTAPRGPR